MSEESHRLDLLRAEADGRRRRSRSWLNAAVRRGELLRLRPGVFVARGEWRRAPPWTQHLAMVAAWGMQRPRTIFCRETALAIYGVPLLGMCRVVHLRTAAPGSAGVRPLFGRLKSHQILPPIPQGMSAGQARQEYVAADPVTAPCKVRVPGITADGVDVAVRVEPLPFALVDTVPRTSRQEAAVILDAAMAGRHRSGLVVSIASLSEAEAWLWSRDSRASWDAALSFADPRSESAGESRSRVLIDELGFIRPSLQTVVPLPDGERARLDFDWEHPGVFGEFDGRVKYDQAERLSGISEQGVYWAEKRREELIELVTAKRPVRWHWGDLERPERLERKLLLRGVPKR